MFSSLFAWKKTMPAKAKNLIPLVVAATGIVITYLTYAPGLVPPDAQDQLQQAPDGAFH